MTNNQNKYENASPLLKGLNMDWMTGEGKNAMEGQLNEEHTGYIVKEKKKKKCISVMKGYHT